MDRERLTSDTLLSLALGCDPLAARGTCLDAEPAIGSVARSLASVAAFWDGSFDLAVADALAATSSADPADLPMAHAVTALALAGDEHVDPCADELFGRLRDLGSGTSPDDHLVRYVAAEAALACARVDDAAAVLAGHPPTAEGWADHPFAVVMQCNAVRTAAFGGDLAAATAMLPGLRDLTERVAGGSRLVALTRSVDDLVLGNATGAMSEGLQVERLPRDPVDHLDRGAHLLTAFGAIAVGDVATATSLVLQAGGDAGLQRFTLIDRALGLELLVVAALEVGDLDAAVAWEGQALTIADHPVTRPTVDRMRSRIALAVGEVAEAIALAERSIADCRVHQRVVEAAEGEMVLARAHIADHDVSEASRRLRAVVAESDAAGHAAVRRSAARTLGAARRRLPPPAHGGWSALSEREQEVGRLVLAGGDIVQIARTLHLSPHTVRGHVSRVLGAFGVASRVGLLDAVGDAPRDPRAATLPDLTARQCEVAELVAAGRTNQQVAEALGISVKSVEKHVGDAMRRWDVLTRFELSRLWRSR